MTCPSPEYCAANGCTANGCREREVDRELRLAKLDIDTPRPEFWDADLARYRAAKAAAEWRP